MPDKALFDARIRFTGSRKNLEKFAAAMAKFKVQVVDPGDLVPFPEPGGWPFPIDRIFDARTIRGFTTRAPRIRIPTGINGGIRPPHLHIGKDVFFVNRVKFNSVLRQVVRKINTRIR